MVEEQFSETFEMPGSTRNHGYTLDLVFSESFHPLAFDAHFLFQLKQTSGKAKCE